MIKMRQYNEKEMHKRIPCFFLIALACSAMIFGAGCTGPASPAPATTPIATTMATVTATAVPSMAMTTPAPTAAPDPGFETKGSLDKTYYYMLDGTPGYVPVKIYTGVNEYITSLGDIYTGDDYTAVIGNEVQRKYVSKMVENIRSTAKNPDDEARIAISLVQHIRYDANAVSEVRYNSSRTGQKYIGRYPYTILDQNWGGICGEKSFLLALLLKELGYGVALFEFDDIHHMAVGIQAPARYTYQGTGYALIESTAPQIPTFADYSFAGTDIRLSNTSPSRTVIISDGKAFATIGTEYSDAELERSVYQAMSNVNRAAAAVNAATVQLDSLRTTAEYWRTKAQNDYAQRDMAGYQNDVAMFDQAKAAYEKYYSEVYTPAYQSWSTLADEYKSRFAPRQKELEDKYGMNTGISVGL